MRSIFCLFFIVSCKETTYKHSMSTIKKLTTSPHNKTIGLPIVLVSGREDYLMNLQ
jgi:hypothetical protein